jgi:hypothetical protein
MWSHSGIFGLEQIAKAIQKRPWMMNLLEKMYISFLVYRPSLQQWMLSRK